MTITSGQVTFKEQQPNVDPVQPVVAVVTRQLPEVPNTEHEMTLQEYMILSQETANYPGVGEGGQDAFAYVFLKLNGEAGEVAEKYGKVLRDKNGQGTEEDRQELIKELGDVLWYIAAAANELNVSLEDVARGNITKLYSRHERGVINGSGDNR